ncbi:MAG: hemolysin III family protein [Spirochaetaceae bacterium]|nr:hemolysin III family protein [Spirochaetaceae bacterium]
MRTAIPRDEARRTGDVAAAVVQMIGGACGLAALPILVVRAAIAGSTSLIVAFSLYGASLGYYFTISALFHLLKAPKARRVFAALDEAGDFFLLAGSWTPLCFSAFGGPLGWALFGTLWGFGFLNLVVVLVTLSRAKNLALAAYYLGVALAFPLLPPVRAALGEGVFYWVALAGLLYAAGLVFKSREDMPYHHGIWHSFVIAASICHFFGLLALT